MLAVYIHVLHSFLVLIRVLNRHFHNSWKWKLQGRSGKYQYVIFWLFVEKHVDTFLLGVSMVATRVRKFSLRFYWIISVVSLNWRQTQADTGFSQHSLHCLLCSRLFCKQT